MIKINTSGDYVQLIYVDPVQESVQQELKSDTDAFECSYDSDGKLYMQFGLMRFENPDPTDFTINGSAVTDAADFITKLNALFTGGGGGSSLFPLTGTSTATGDITADLDGHNLNIESEGFGYMLNMSNLQVVFAANDGTADAAMEVVASSGEGVEQFNLRILGSVNNIIIAGDAVANSITYTAGNHVFVGLADYVDDAAAAAGGVPVNGLYYSMGTVKIRLS